MALGGEWDPPQSLCGGGSAVPSSKILDLKWRIFADCQALKFFFITKRGQNTRTHGMHG